MPPGTYKLDADTAVVVMFDKSGQVSSLMRAHPKQEWEAGWNAAIESVLKYVKQPTLRRYEQAIKNLSS